MANIIHDPTRGWLLLTEKWPEKPVLQYLENSPIWNAIQDQMKGDHEEAVAHCLSTAIEIDEEYWDEIRMILGHQSKTFEESQEWKFKNHHPYSVDAEFEVIARLCEKCGGHKAHYTDKSVTGNMEFCDGSDKIARLVKAKPMEDFKKFTLLNPTDSVTSDGTAIKVDNRPRFTEASKARMREWTEGERRDAINYLHELNGQSMTKEPTESQDELMTDFLNCIWGGGKEQAKKRFRIERI